MSSGGGEVNGLVAYGLRLTASGIGAVSGQPAAASQLVLALGLAAGSGLEASGPICNLKRRYALSRWGREVCVFGNSQESDESVNRWAKPPCSSVPHCRTRSAAPRSDCVRDRARRNDGLADTSGSLHPRRPGSWCADKVASARRSIHSAASTQYRARRFLRRGVHSRHDSRAGQDGCQ